MLFDLRGRGRRRTVQVIYLSLALLMGLGLVLFGIGGATDGGLLNAFDSQNDPGSVDKVAQQQLERAEKGVKARRNDPAAWATLARVRAARASQGAGYDEATQKYTDEGKKELAEADRAWKQSRKLAGEKPDPTVAAIMANAYTALEKPKDAVEALEVVIDDKGKNVTSEQYQQYAVLSYQAGQNRKGDLAAARAVALTPKAQRKALKDQLEQLKTEIATKSLPAEAGNPAPAPPGG